MKKQIYLFMAAAALLTVACGGGSDETPGDGENGSGGGTELPAGLKVEVSDVFAVPVYVRSGRDVKLTAYVYNNEGTSQSVEVALELPAQIECISGSQTQKVSALQPGNANRQTVSWTVRPSASGELAYSIRITGKEKYNKCDFKLYAWDAQPVETMSYPPEPVPVETGEYLVGCFRCPLWYEAPDGLPSAWLWANRDYRRYADRMPVLGQYNEHNAEVVDWELKWASEHGISFFVDCWFRKKGNAGNSQVEGWLDHWSKRMCDPATRYRESVRFAIAWENSNTAADNITDAVDFTDNLVPYWIETYFRQPNYMTVGGKPLFILYNPMNFITQAGGREKAAEALRSMRQKVADAGLPGVYIMTVHNEGSQGLASGTDYSDISYLRTELGIDAITAYNLPTFTHGLGVGSNPDGATVIAKMKAAWENLKQISGMRTYPVASMGYDTRPWGADTDPAGWVLAPADYSQVLTYAKQFVGEEVAGSEDPKIVMLDNWNEYAEGHYLAPTHKYGFRHLDMVRTAFATTQPAHTDLVPEDIGRGPYEYPIGE